VRRERFTRVVGVDARIVGVIALIVGVLVIGKEGSRRVRVEIEIGSRIDRPTHRSITIDRPIDRSITHRPIDRSPSIDPSIDHPPIEHPRSIDPSSGGDSFVGRVRWFGCGGS